MYKKHVGGVVLIFFTSTMNSKQFKQMDIFLTLKAARTSISDLIDDRGLKCRILPQINQIGI